jgi:hypothetical protein
MTLTTREFWTALHGMLLGAAFLLAFTGCAVSLWSLRSHWMTAAGRAGAVRCLLIGSWSMALLAWMTVSVGTFVVYPWYRAKPPAGTATSSLIHYPRSLLMSTPKTEDWHEVGMEWKEHIGWLAPFLATAVAIVATRNRRTLADQATVRHAMLLLLGAAFFCASVAGIFGAFINKMAPVR